MCPTEAQELTLLVLAYGGARRGDVTVGGPVPEQRSVQDRMARTLEAIGLVEVDEDTVRLTEAGLQAAKAAHPVAVRSRPMHA